MRKYLFPLCLAMSLTVAHAGNSDSNFTVNAGFLFNNTLNATFGMERELSYSDAVEIFGEVGARWSKDSVGNRNFRDAYYWGGGALYKRQVCRFKNSMLRLRVGPECGAYTGNYFFAVEGSLEYNIVLPNRVQLSISQKNQIGFFHGDNFRNGLLLGIKIPF